MSRQQRQPTPTPPHTPGPYVIGLPGGPSGPFWSIVGGQGQIVAMMIPSEANARAIVAGLTLLNQQAAAAEGTDGEKERHT